MTVRSEEPIEGDLLAAVASGEASLLFEEAAACADGAAAGPSPTPEISPMLVPVLEGTVTGTPEELLVVLRIEPEDDADYDRERFKHWISASGNGCNTRQQVLIDESLTPVTIGSDCKIQGGSWVSVFDGVVTSEPSTFDVDHVVPLKEAWSSSASAWTDDRRRDFANDLDDERSLRAVSASSNRSKGAQDPADLTRA